MPSAEMLVKICNAFGLDMGAALRAFAGGKLVMAQWLRDEIFDKEDEQPGSADEEEVLAVAS
jgi:hypothetical protein